MIASELLGLDLAVALTVGQVLAPNMVVRALATGPLLNILGLLILILTVMILCTLTLLNVQIVQYPSQHLHPHAAITTRSGLINSI